MIYKDTELKMIGEKTKAIFDMLEGSPVTTYDRVVKIGRTMKAIEYCIENLNIPPIHISLFMLSECLSQVRDLERDLRPAEQSKDDD